MLFMIIWNKEQRGRPTSYSYKAAHVAFS